MSEYSPPPYFKETDIIPGIGQEDLVVASFRHRRDYGFIIVRKHKAAHGGSFFTVEIWTAPSKSAFAEFECALSYAADQPEVSMIPSVEAGIREAAEVITVDERTVEFPHDSVVPDLHTDAESPQPDTSLSPTEDDSAPDTQSQPNPETTTQSTLSAF
ncbi:hypothetical protein RYH80_18265 [Halobaculum sp. MBLA0147]|uniref:hypothetical protein n=1 Tax=Halobaculum sp. MBLA0147 TaxID=3079934 RepID=UPI003523682A